MNSKDKEYINKTKKIIMLLVICILTIIPIASFAENTDNDEIISIKRLKSKEYEDWENLEDSERLNTVEPIYNSNNFKNYIKRSTYNALLKDTVSLENKFDLRDQISIKVKSQRRLPACWAFAFTSMLETTMQRKYGISKEYSPMHMDYRISKDYEKELGVGGNLMISISYGVTGRGPVYESDFPLESVYDEEKNSAENYYMADLNSVNVNLKSRATLKDVTFFPNIYKERSGNTIKYKNTSGTEGAKEYTENEVKAIRTMIKNHIKTTGGVYASFYTADLGNVYPVAGYTSNYYNKETYAFCVPNSNNSPSHAVTIIGWDDNYKKENFNSANRPIHDGAYIVLNSWAEKFGDKGCFYVSYDDISIEQGISGIDKVDVVNESDPERKVYEYDPTGYSISINYISKDKKSYEGSGYTANVFKRENPSNKYEYLSEVGIFLDDAEGVEVYVNAEDGDLNKGVLAATYTGNSALNAGYHTLKLSSPILLTGEKFAVKIKYINAEGATFPLECNLRESGLTNVAGISDLCKSNAGESFISHNGKDWKDLKDLNYADVTLKNTNACIKAISTYSSTKLTTPVTGIELNKSSATINVGNTVSLVATVKPENATNKNVNWKSSNTNIATVKNGVVTGVTKGTTTITVTTEDGNYSKTCNITVEEKVTENEIKVTGVELDKNTATVKVGNTTSLTATVKPENATNKNIKWKSSDKNIATVKNGVVTGVAKGITTITVTTEDGSYSANCEITVEVSEVIEVENEVKVTGVELNKEEKEIQVGDVINLTATVTPTKATNKAVSWSSSDESVATISSAGIIKALKAGETTIEVRTKDGNYTATCKIVVKDKSNVDNDIYTTPTDDGEDLTSTTTSDKDLDETSNNTPNDTSDEISAKTSNLEARVDTTVVVGDTKNESSTSTSTTTAKSTDKTTAKKVLPRTGADSIIVVIIIGIVLGVVSFIKYNRVKGIK